ncbi:acetyltransferase [Prevotella copri]|uniref:Acetyltransferase n=1 Tax=Segatella copri TaxID=165179 RepID=A0AAW5IS34_9BACT|nr:acetyltransferase [Segatella copri]MCP9552821.1 acetyltransferase [Segatella copri]MCP9573893.1 acetyltransferase [Segatella copri]MCP9576667.1 acetyltransferase [Segatella copri]MCP9579451.1 acetyltransferase [Segatella copri]MCP9582706.1 acetyltransferase [Segatella copri]
MKRPLILIGGGGHCKSVIEVAESAGYEIKGILDMPDEVGKEVLPGHKVIGTDDEIPQNVEECDFIITVGFIKNPALRIKLYNKVKAAGGRLATIIASTAHVSKYAELGEGTVIMHHAFVNAGAKIGDNCIINTFVNIEHDAEVGNQCHISTGTMVNGECKIGENCFIGSQSVCANCIEIASDIIVGAGSVIRKSIRVKGIYAGNPAILKIKAK